MCMEIILDKRKQELVKSYVPSEQSLKDLALFFSLLSDSTRLKILSALSISSMCVNDLSALLGLNQTTLSHQLSRLRSAKIVDYRKQGKISFYYISSAAIAEILLSASKEI
ncbi:MAG: winged helix-turn-helix transcriptional regulator [Clostridia bacterium]|nr:winged helix-turn-helix transcriptional regulator [Clostridia bacterium]